MFTTEHLRLRAYEPRDHSNLLSLYNDTRVTPYLTSGYLIPHTTDRIDYLMKVIKESVMFCIVDELDTNEFVGLTTFLPLDNTESKNRCMTWGIAITPTKWHKGYGYELGSFMIDHAFHQFGSHRVSLTVLGENTRALRLYKKLGFVEEGRTRKLIWRDGGWHDKIHMGILDEEWAARKRALSAVEAGQWDEQSA